LDRYGAAVDLDRVALTREHVANRGLPSFEAITKRKDPRYRWFVGLYGARCWELDALSPVILRETVEKRIFELIDTAYWERCAVVERAERESLVGIMAEWKRIVSGP